jgi:hypothetical protein
MDGVDCCHVGYLLQAYALDSTIYDGVLCQVTEVFEKNGPSHVISEKWHKNKGFARVMVISALNEWVLCKGGEETTAVGGVKGDYLS